MTNVIRPTTTTTYNLLIPFIILPCDAMHKHGLLVRCRVCHVHVLCQA